MFTKEEIKAAHSKVKTGADYPKYVHDLKQLGIAKYDYLVEDGSNIYYDARGNSVSLKLTSGTFLQVAAISSSEKIKLAVKITQQGKSDFQTFCAQAADAGVERWTSDLENMTCSYFDLQGMLLFSEGIPGV